MSYEGREPIFVTVDGIVSCYDKSDGNMYILLIKRLKDPYKGRWCFPGGHLDADDTSIISACEREVLEETGVYAKVYHSLFVRDEIGRDPRGRYINHPHLLHQIPDPNVRQTPRARTDASAAKWFKLQDVKEMDLAFDHNLILLNAFWAEEYWKQIEHNRNT